MNKCLAVNYNYYLVYLLNAPAQTYIKQKSLILYEAFMHHIPKTNLKLHLESSLKYKNPFLK